MAVRLGLIRTDSPLGGLRRRRLGFLEVLAQSVAATAPSAAAVTVPGIVISLAGASAPWAFVAATGIIVLVAYCVTQFARRMASASGLYSYTAKGLGVTAAFTTGWSLMIGYAGAAMASALGAGIYLESLVGLLGVDGTGKTTVAFLVLVVSAIAAGLMVRGIQLSARVSLVLEILSVGLVAAILVALLVARPAAGGTLATGEPGFDAATLGVLLAVTAFVGFESAGTLGAETRNPLRAVPRALRWTPFVLAVFYLFAVLAQTDIFAGQPASILSSGSPIADLAAREHRDALGVLLDLGIFSSWFACLMGSTNALVRVLFSMGREGICPEWLGRTHRRFGTPVPAIATAIPVIAIVPLVVLRLESSIVAVFTDLLTLSAFGYLVAYGLVCIATPAFLRRLGELTAAPAVVGVLGAVSILFLVVWTVARFGFASGSFALVYLVIMVLAWAWLGILRWRRPGVLSEVGVYDEPIASDMLPVIELGERR